MAVSYHALYLLLNYSCRRADWAKSNKCAGQEARKDQECDTEQCPWSARYTFLIKLIDRMLCFLATCSMRVNVSGAWATREWIHCSFFLVSSYSTWFLSGPCHPVAMTAGPWLVYQYFQGSIFSLTLWDFPKLDKDIQISQTLISITTVTLIILLIMSFKLLFLCMLAFAFLAQCW